MRATARIIRFPTRPKERDIARHSARALQHRWHGYLRTMRSYCCEMRVAAAEPKLVAHYAKLIVEYKAMAHQIYLDWQREITRST